MANRCPECGSQHVSDEWDTLDGLYDAYAWWTCLDCGHSWRYQDRTLNPDKGVQHGQEEKGSEANRA